MHKARFIVLAQERRWVVMDRSGEVLSLHFSKKRRALKVAALLERNNPTEGTHV